MSACEACWKEASGIALHSGRGTADVYEELIASRPKCPHITLDIGSCQVNSVSSRVCERMKPLLCDFPALGRIRRLERKLEAAGNPRCKWATAMPDDVAPIEAPGPLCVGCYKHPVEDAS